MARRVFFSFHYQNDVWRANQIRNLDIVVGQAAAGFQDASLWEATKLKGDDALKKLINDGLSGTTVTVVLIGEKTAQRKWIKYEIAQSIARGNGLLGVFIHNRKDQNGNTSARGAIPQGLLDAKAPCYEWEQSKFGEWIEKAAAAAGKSAF